MKIAYKHLVKHIRSKPDINELSNILFQLGHEHEIEKEIFDMEFTPNRGDCLSVNGLLRDLQVFYDVDTNKKIYEKEIKSFNFNLINNAKFYCKNISFLKIEIDKIPHTYNEELESYFSLLQNNKNNFFTDISNFISYEMGQPTHCYDSSALPNLIKLELVNENYKFKTLLDDTIELSGNDLVFLDKNNNVLNLAGVIGGKSTACKENTKSVIIECAHFDPEIILGKSVTYSINSGIYVLSPDVLGHLQVVERVDMTTLINRLLENKKDNIKYHERDTP